MKIRVTVAFILASMLFPILSIAGDVILIANPLVAESKLSRKEVRNIYLGKRTTWDDGTKIVFVLQKDSDVHEAFLKKYIHKSPSQFDLYWRRQMFTGAGLPPKVFNSQKALIKYIGETKGAIGYVSSDSEPVNVKTISVEE